MKKGRPVNELDWHAYNHDMVYQAAQEAGEIPYLFDSELGKKADDKFLDDIAHIKGNAAKIARAFFKSKSAHRPVGRVVENQLKLVIDKGSIPLKFLRDWQYVLGVTKILYDEATKYYRFKDGLPHQWQDIDPDIGMTEIVTMA